MQLAAREEDYSLASRLRDEMAPLNAQLHPMRQYLWGRVQALHNAGGKQERLDAITALGAVSCRLVVIDVILIAWIVNSSADDTCRMRRYLDTCHHQGRVSPWPNMTVGRFVKSQNWAGRDCSRMSVSSPTESVHHGLVQHMLQTTHPTLKLQRSSQVQS